jgi:effector-binding domain-containing protein
MTDFEVVTLRAQPAAVMRAEVPMSELTDVFDRGFTRVAEAVREQGLELAAAPFGFYPRMPGETVAVAVGFPVSAELRATGDVEPMELPAGRAIRGIHVGPYDQLERTYGELIAWAGEQGLALKEGMWETYLSDPAAEPDPTTWRTEITWPVE